MAECIALKMDGNKCSSRANHGEYCGTHNTSRNKAGPNAFLVKQLRYRHHRECNDFVRLRREEEGHLTDDVEIERFKRNTATLLGMIYQRQRLEQMDLADRQIQRIQETGVDPDAEAAERRAAIREHRNEMMRDRVAAAHQERIAMVRAIRREPVVQAVDRRELAMFAADRQNVHTTEAVIQTKKIISRVLKIPVPEAYRWNPDVASLTPFEIGMNCKLSQKGAWQMMSMYAQDTAIYDIDVGIYGKVLDSAWQFVKASPDKDDLCRILKQEMEDNIGMCAQGNLSRICNILAGYMDGVGPQESTAEMLGREISALMDIENRDDRLAAAIKILQENNVPREQWDDWTNPLVEMEGIVIGVV